RRITITFQTIPHCSKETTVFHQPSRGAVIDSRNRFSASFLKRKICVLFHRPYRRRDGRDGKSGFAVPSIGERFGERLSFYGIRRR
ncbi:hypothetical protein, partial [Geobacillus sp. B4113_201601]|uniref:hypothetical protein n=1 Tax=Geobacillus sp. B4113_201601 TaxID=1586290 RepID=UPI001F42819A